MTTFFTSDQHFGHAAIIGYCARPFSSVDEMNAEMVRRFNSRVSADDTTYHLGDFAFDQRRVAYWLSRLNGTHHLIAGNHDGCHPIHRRHVREGRRYLDAGFASVAVRDVINVEPLGRAMLCHLPLRALGDSDQRYAERRPTGFDLAASGARLLLHGHVHEKWRVRGGRMVNVGVDQWGFAPVTATEIAQAMANARYGDDGDGGEKETASDG